MRYVKKYWKENITKLMIKKVKTYLEILEKNTAALIKKVFFQKYPCHLLVSLNINNISICFCFYYILLAFI